MCQIVGEQVDVRFDLAAELPLVEMDPHQQHTLRTPEPIFTGKKPSRGAGLALTTAHGILQQSGGTFSVAPGAGRGAVITLTLPARDAGGYLPRT